MATSRDPNGLIPNLPNQSAASHYSSPSLCRLNLPTASSLPSNLPPRHLRLRLPYYHLLLLLPFLSAPSRTLSRPRPTLSSCNSPLRLHRRHFLRPYHPAPPLCISRMSPLRLPSFLHSPSRPKATPPNFRVSRAPGPPFQPPSARDAL